ncbi:hypothetical protein D3C73_1092990 [compost metagenome]
MTSASVFKVPVAVIDQCGQQRQERRIVHRVTQLDGINAEVLAHGIDSLQMLGIHQFAVHKALITNAQYAQATQTL